MLSSLKHTEYQNIKNSNISLVSHKFSNIVFYLGEQHKLQVFEDRVLTNVFGSKKDE
jgi:hypothetical protein